MHYRQTCWTQHTSVYPAQLWRHFVAPCYVWYMVSFDDRLAVVGCVSLCCGMLYMVSLDVGLIAKEASCNTQLNFGNQN